MAILKQSTAFTRMFLMVDSTDHISAKTGLTVTVTVSKAGGAFGAAGGTVTEVSSGWYKIALTTTDTNTLGDLAYHCTSTGADATDFVDQVSVRLIDDAAFPATSGRSMVVDASGLVDANTVKIGPTGSGTAQTARDVGASVLLSTGTGTGQLDFTSGVVKANLAQILGTALTETAGLIAAGFKQFFNIASPTSTMNTITTVTTATNLTNAPTAGDLTATMKTSVTTACTASTPTAAAVTGAVGSVTGNVGGSVASVTAVSSGAITSGSFAAGAIDAAAIAANAIGSSEFAQTARDAVSDALLARNIAGGSSSGRIVTDALSVLRNKVDIAAGTMTVYATDDSSTQWTAAITTTAGNPITTVDPA